MERKTEEKMPLSLSSKKWSDRPFILMGFCLVLGLALSLFLLKYNYFVHWDGCLYTLSGKNLVSGQGYTTWGRPQLHFPPFYPLLIGIFYKFMGNLELAGHAVSIVSFLVSIVLFFKLAEFIYNKSAAFFATILFTTNFLILCYSHCVLTHSVDILLIIIAVYLASSIIKNEKLRYKNFILLGIILACAILNRPENIILSSAVIISIFVLKRQQVRKKIICFASLTAVLIALLLPYVNFLHTHTGKWALTTKIKNLQFYEYMTSKDPLARHKQKELSFADFNPFEYIRQNKRKLLKRYLLGARLFSERLSVILYRGFGFILIGLGLFGQPWDRDRKKIEILLFACLTPLMILPLGNVLQRYFLSYLPIFLLWIAKGLENLSIFIKNTYNLSSQKVALVIGLVVILLLLPTVVFIVNQKSNPPGKKIPFRHKQMGLWMKSNIEDIENKLIGLRCPIVAFYSGGQFRWVPIIEENYWNLINDLKKRKVDYLIIDQYILKRYPHLKFLLDDQKKHDGLVKVHTIEAPKKIILYKIE